MNSPFSTAVCAAAGRASVSNVRLGPLGAQTRTSWVSPTFLGAGRRGQRGLVVTNSSSAYSSNPGGNRVKRGKDKLDPRNTSPPRAEQSVLVNREVVLFLLQLELPSQQMRGLRDRVLPRQHLRV